LSVGGLSMASWRQSPPVVRSQAESGNEAEERGQGPFTFPAPRPET
jgi:hypothetical protein